MTPVDLSLTAAMNALCVSLRVFSHTTGNCGERTILVAASVMKFWTAPVIGAASIAA